MKTKIIIIAFTLTSLFVACHDDLEIAQKSAITTVSMWQDEGDAQAAMYGMYCIFRSSNSNNYIFWGDFRSGTFGPGLGSFNDYNIVNSTLHSGVSTGTNWVGQYSTINDCNQLIKNVSQMSFSNEDTRNMILANAYFIRAFCYYTIVRVWGDAPLLTEGFDSDKQDLFPSRVSANLLYAQIGEDIEEALRLMPESVASRTTASRGSINMLKTDYNLWLYKTRNAGTPALDAAETAIDAVVGNTSTYELLSNYASVFDINNKNNKEIIFAMHYGKDEYEGGYPEDWLIPTSKYTSSPAHIETDVKVGSLDQWYCFSTSFQMMLKENPADSRTPVSFQEFTAPDNGVTYKWINKFPGEWTNSARYFTSDIPVYRFAEAILFKAEIENEKGGDPLLWLNKIAKRAYGVDDYYPSLSKSEMNEIIFNERMKEFAGEGKSWWDHIRMGYVFIKIPALVGRQNETNILLWPIGNSSMSANPNIRQTEGYN
jgi:hypothetical protein